MKNTCKRIIAMLLAVAMCLSLLSVSVWAGEKPSEDDSLLVQSSEVALPEESAPSEVREEQAKESLTPQASASGKCGKDLTWTLDEGGTLTINGTGEMYDFTYDTRPWNKYYEDIQTVIIGDGVTTISRYAFYSCYNLTSLSIGSGVISIGEEAFEYCRRIANVTIPASVTSIGAYAFSGCTALSNVRIGSGVNSIGYHAFKNTPWFTGLGDFAIANGILFAYQGDRYSDAEIVIPDTVTTVLNEVFSGCYMTSVVIPDSVTSIGASAFSGCTALTNVNIGNGVTSIGEGAFSGCSALTSVVVPDSVTSIGRDAFSSCSALTNVTIGNGVTSIGLHAFSMCSALSSLTIPNSVTTIDIDAFYGCKNLTLFVYFDSPAHSYAKKTYRIKYQVLDKQPNTINAKDIVQSYSAKSQSVRLNASANGATLSYQPDNSKVTVDKNGKVTLPAKFSGTVTITITAEESPDYLETTKTVTVTVPTVPGSLKAAAGKGQISVQWKKNTTGKGYEVQYSTDKKFKKGAKTVKIGKNKTTKTTIKKLKKGTYYVRIRTVNGAAYSDWSSAKTVKITK